VRLPGSILQGILARAALVLLRIYLGVIFLLAAWPQLKGASAFSTASLGAALIPGGELLVGLTLVLGLFTRLAAAVALLLVANRMFAQGPWLWEPTSNDAAFAVIAVALLIGAAGRTFGLDALLAKRWPRSPFW
jgi:uncharacterized membrane protein YphA (DoxX/SURF4 family)